MSVLDALEAKFRTALPGDADVGRVFTVLRGIDTALVDDKKDRWALGYFSGLREGVRDPFRELVRGA